jgi:DNA repair exonuclease SbcCD ATPase subunit
MNSSLKTEYLPKMLITIDSFRHHATYTLDVKKGITLISGQSGVGKSTIFRAIQWCLYGKLQHYTPILKPRARTTVTIIYPLPTGEKWEIMRQGHPNLFRITVGESVYSGTDAEALISEHFGSEDVFLSCCYLEQMNRNHLLSLPQTERLKVLHHLSFSNTSPEEIKKAIASAISETKKEFDTLKIRQSASNNELERFLPLIGDEEKANTIYNLSREGIKSDITTITATIEDLEAKQRMREEALTRRKGYEEKKVAYIQQLQKLEAKLREYPPEDVLKARTESLKRKQRAKEQEAERKKREEARKKIEQEMTKLRVLVSNHYGVNIDKFTMDREYTEQDRRSAKLHEKMYNERKEILERSKELYSYIPIHNAEDAEFVVVKITEELEARSYWRLEDDIKKLRKASEKLEEKLERKKYILNAIRESNCYSCPHCSGKFALEDGTPVAVHPSEKKEEDIVELREELRQLNIEIPVLEQTRRNMTDKEKMLEKLPTPLESRRLDKDLVDDYKRLVDDLRRFASGYYDSYVDPPNPSSAEIAKYLDVSKHKSAYQVLLNSLNSLPPPSEPALLEPILPEETRAANELKELHQLQGRHKELKEQLQTILDSIKSQVIPPDLSSELSKARLRKEELQTLLKQKDIVDKIAEIMSEIEERDAQMDILIDKHKELTAIMEVAKRVEHETLTSVVEGINENLAIIGEKLFDTPINIRLRLDRELKTREGTKADVNISITYQGAEYKLNQLSGGEQDRVSLALLLALSQLSSVGFLLLDEATAYLDQEYRERVIDVLRTYSSDKCVLSIEHEAVSGLYDKEIVLEG